MWYILQLEGSHGGLSKVREHKQYKQTLLTFLRFQKKIKIVAVSYKTYSIVLGVCCSALLYIFDKTSVDYPSMGSL